MCIFTDKFSGPLPFLCDFEMSLCNYRQFLAGTDFPDNGDWRWQGGVAISRKEGLLTGPLFDATYNVTIFVDNGIDIYSFHEITFCSDLLQNMTIEEAHALNCTESIPEGKIMMIHIDYLDYVIRQYL